MGSSDRKMTSRFMYNYFRLGKALSGYGVPQRLAFAEFLCEQESSFLQVHHTALHENIMMPLDEKVEYLTTRYGFVLKEVFPFPEQLSEGVDRQHFLLSHFVQPDLFIRVKRSQLEVVRQFFDREGIPYEFVGGQALRLPNGFRLQDYPQLKGMFEVQDLSSQHTIHYMDAQRGEMWWDACAASGGKALMFLDKYPDVALMVSDIRLSILRNLNERFEVARVPAPRKQKILDLSSDISSLMRGESFDGIILDVPCSGSGTWGRTPEMIQQFSKDKMLHFKTLQRSIVDNVVSYLKVGKPLVYMTCSAYREENEDMIKHLVDKHSFRLEKMEIIKGYTQRADTMFAARLVRER